MPAYFNISVQFKRTDIYQNFIEDFYTMLDDIGMKFKSGYWEHKDSTISQIIKWNQTKLEQNFKLGYTEHCSHDYIQVMYEYNNYSEVRGFWLNNYPEDELFSYEIIIPESDVLDCDYPIRFNKSIYKLIELAKLMWQFPGIVAIQTGLELDAASVGINEIVQGKFPKTVPFSILEYNFIENNEYEKVKIDGTHTGVMYIDSEKK